MANKERQRHLRQLEMVVEEEGRQIRQGTMLLDGQQRHIRQGIMVIEGKQRHTVSGEALTLANGQSLVDNTTRYIQGNTTTTPTEKYKAKSSQGEVGRSDWLPGEDTMVTK